MYPIAQQQAQGMFSPMMGMPFRNVMPQVTTLYVGNLDSNVTEELLFSYFSKYGLIYSLKIPKDRQTKISRGFGFVNFFQPNCGRSFL